MGGYTRWGARGWQVLLPEYPMESPPPPHGTAAKQPELDLAPAPAPAVLCSPCTLRPVVDINAQWPLLERNTGPFATVRLYDTASVLCFHCFRDQNTAFHCGPQVQFWAEAVRAKFPANGHLVALLAEPWFPAMLEADGSGASRWVGWGGGAVCPERSSPSRCRHLLRLRSSCDDFFTNGQWQMGNGSGDYHTDELNTPDLTDSHRLLFHPRHSPTALSPKPPTRASSSR